MVIWRETKETETRCPSSGRRNHRNTTQWRVKGTVRHFINSCGIDLRIQLDLDLIPNDSVTTDKSKSLKSVCLSA